MAEWVKQQLSERRVESSNPVEVEFKFRWKLDLQRRQFVLCHKNYGRLCGHLHIKFLRCCLTSSVKMALVKEPIARNSRVNGTLNKDAEGLK